MATLIFEFVFYSNANPVVVLTSTELTGGAAPTVNISKRAFADGAITSVVSGGVLTYDSYCKSWSYRLTDADLSTYRYLGAATTTYATASPATQHALGIVVPDELVGSRLATSGYTAPPTASAVASQVRTELTTELARIDGTVTSRLAAASYTTPPTVGAIADQVWDEVLSDHATSGSAGAALNRVGTAAVTFTAPTTSDGTGIHLVRGDDYLNTDSRALTFSGTTWPTLTSGTVSLRVQFSTTSVTAYSGTVTGAQACRVELTDTQTAAMSPGVYPYDLEAVLSNGSVVTLVQGMLSVGPDVR